MTYFPARWTIFFACALATTSNASCAADGETSRLAGGDEPATENPGGGFDPSGDDDAPLDPTGGAGAGSAAPCDPSTPDADGDGFTVEEGDCNDCAASVNPAAFDKPGDNVDGDCNGAVDDEPAGCDAAVSALDSNDPLDAARALGLCRGASDTSWGVVSASYVTADGSPGMDARGHGLLRGFGSNVGPREGSRLLALSSGTARAPGDVGYQSPDGSDLGSQSSTPSGFPMNSPSCSQAIHPGTTAFDPAALQITLRVPSNASSYQVDFNFYTFEFPEFVCDAYNDFFVLLQSPAPATSQFGNVAFDNLGNPVSVNNGYLEVCSPQTAGGKSFDCPQGPALLSGTGFDTDEFGGSRAATGWLMTHSPVQPGSEVTLRFAVWDTGDPGLTSTVLVDNFRWVVTDAPSDPPPDPVTTPVPK